MRIPNYQVFMLPLLRCVSDGKEHRIQDVINSLSNKFGLTEEERVARHPSGNRIIDVRIGWARTSLLKAGLLSAPKRGYIKITERGLDVLRQNPKTIDVKYLKRFPEFLEWEIDKTTIKDKENELENATPDELIEKGYGLINASLAQELLEKLRKIDPYLFEKVVGELLHAMNYGRFEVTSRSGDQGIDGIVYQDKLGLDKILFQAKRYSDVNSVPIRDIRDFVGALDLQGASKGIFITTSRFTKDANDILRRTPKNIILIDGPRLAELMIEHEVGVKVQKIYKIKKIDLDFFEEIG